MPGPAAGLIVGGAVKVLGGIFGASAAKREARRREAQARALEAKLNDLEANMSVKFKGIIYFGNPACKTQIYQPILICEKISLGGAKKV